jgi:hypothetical protein
MTQTDDIQNLLNEFRPYITSIQKALKNNPELGPILKASVTSVYTGFSAYRQARKLQPIFAKLVTGERITYRESYQVFTGTANFVAGLVASGYVGYRNMKTLLDYQETK